MWPTILLVSALFLAHSQTSDPDPRRQFDFWIGEWSVQNRHLAENGEWNEGDVTRARITPVLGGGAILEEWAGPFMGAFMNGFSLRAWEPEAKRWKLLLHWTANGSGIFGVLEGSFRNGRGEFFVPGRGRDGNQTQTRYTFSEMQPDSVRWDSAASKDGGQTWRTDWIMEFTRTRPAGELNEALLFEQDWTEGEGTGHKTARALDFLLGEWVGEQKEGDLQREARLRCKTISQQNLVIEALAIREPGAAEWSERFGVHGYVPQLALWESWSLSQADPRLRRMVGEPTEGAVRVQGAVEGSDVVDRRTWKRVSDDEVRLEEARSTDGGAFKVLRVTKLRRAK